MLWLVLMPDRLFRFAQELPPVSEPVPIGATYRTVIHNCKAHVSAQGPLLQHNRSCMAEKNQTIEPRASLLLGRKDISAPATRLVPLAAGEMMHSYFRFAFAVTHTDVGTSEESLDFKP